MPSRRTVLATAAAGASALAGCSVVEDSLPRARHGDDPQLPDGSQVVARAETTAETDEKGAFWQMSYAAEHEDHLYIYTRHQLVPGTNQHDTDWKLAGFTVDHDYGELDPAGPVDGDASYEWVSDVGGDDSNGSGVRIGMGREPDELGRVVHWHVSYEPASDATWGPEFVTSLRLREDAVESLSEGDPLATTRLTARTTRWPFGSGEHETSAELVYGEDAP